MNMNLLPLKVTELHNTVLDIIKHCVYVYLPQLPSCMLSVANRVHNTVIEGVEVIPSSR